MEEIIKVKYRCRKCKKENEFDTNYGIMELRENINTKTDVYIIKCKFCCTENRIPVPVERGSNE